MVQTKAGGIKYRQTMINKFGSEEAWKEYLRSLAKKGGANGKTGGFASKKIGKDGLTGPMRAALAGAIGGKRRLGYRKETN